MFSMHNKYMYGLLRGLEMISTPHTRVPEGCVLSLVMNNGALQ